MMTAVKRISLLLLTCFGLSAQAADLRTVYNMALKSDPTLKSALASLKATRTGKPQARALFLPNVSISANTTWNELTGSSNARFNSHGHTLSITQPLFNYSFIIQYRQADISSKKAMTEYEAAKQSLIVRVAEAYFGVLSARDALRFARAEKLATKRQLQQAKKRFEVGLIAITDVHEAQATYDQTVAREIAAINALDSAREALQEITGHFVKHLKGLGKTMPMLAPQPANLKQWTDIADRQNLQLRAARYNTELAQQGIRLQRAGHMPTLDIVASRSKSIANGGISGPSNTDSDAIGLQFKLPLFSGGAVAARTREAAYLYQQARHQTEVQRRATLRQARDAYRGVVAGISQVSALNQATISSQSALKATRAGFDVGTRTIVDVLNAQREMFRARQNYARARYDYILNLLRLKQAAGTLAVSDLDLINTWLTVAR